MAHHGKHRSALQQLFKQVNNQKSDNNSMA